MPSVQVGKEVLHFHGHGHGIASSDTLRIVNVSPYPVTYKMKTTNTKRYAVRPNLAIIAAGSCADVTVIHNSRQEMPVGPGADKFLLEVATIPDAPEGSESFSATHFWEARKAAMKGGSRRGEDIAAAAVKVDSFHFTVAFVESSDIYADRDERPAAPVGSDDSTALSTRSSWTAHVQEMKHRSRTHTKTPSCAPKSKRASSIGVKTAKSRHDWKAERIGEYNAEDERDDSIASDRSTGSTPTPDNVPSQEDPVLEDASRRRSSGKKSGIVPPQPSPKDSEADHQAQVILEVGSGRKDGEDVLDVPIEAAQVVGEDVTLLQLGPDVTVQEAKEAIKQVKKEGGESEYVILSQPIQGQESEKKESEKKESEKKESEKKESEKQESEKKESEEKEGEKPESEKKDAEVTVIVQQASSDSGGSDTISAKATHSSPSDDSQKKTATSAGTGSRTPSDDSKGTVGKTGSSKPSSEGRTDSKRTGDSDSDSSDSDDGKGLVGRTKDKMKRKAERAREKAHDIKEKMKEKFRRGKDKAEDEKEEAEATLSNKSDEVDETLKKVAQRLAGSSENEDDGEHDDRKDSSSDDSSNKPSLADAVNEYFKKDVLYHGEIAPTPPNERHTPARLVNSRYGTEPTERSISDLSNEDSPGNSGTVEGDYGDAESNHFYHSHDGDNVSYGDYSGTVSTAPSGRFSEARTYMNDSRSDSSYMPFGRRDFDDDFGRRRPPGPWGGPRFPPYDPRRDDAERRFMGLPPARPMPFDRERRHVLDDFPNGDYRPAPGPTMKMQSAVKFADNIHPGFQPPPVAFPPTMEAHAHHNGYGRAMDTAFNGNMPRQFDDDELTMYPAPRSRRRRRRKKVPPPPPPPPPTKKDSSSSSSSYDAPVIRLPLKKTSERRPTPLPSPSNSPPESPEESATLLATVPGAKTNKEAKETVEKALKKISVRMGGDSDAGSDVSVVGSGSDERDTRSKAVLTASGKKITLMPVSPVHSENDEDQIRMDKLRKLNARLEEATANLDQVREELALVGESGDKPKKKKSRRKSNLNPEDSDY